MSTAVAMSMDDNSSPQEDVGIMGKYYASKIGELREVGLSVFPETGGIHLLVSVLVFYNKRLTTAVLPPLSFLFLKCSLSLSLFKLRRSRNGKPICSD